MATEEQEHRKQQRQQETPILALPMQHLSLGLEHHLRLVTLVLWNEEEGEGEVEGSSTITPSASSSSPNQVRPLANKCYDTLLLDERGVVRLILSLQELLRDLQSLPLP